MQPQSQEPINNLSDTSAFLFALRSVVNHEHAEVAVLGQVKEEGSTLKSSEAPLGISSTLL